MSEILCRTQVTTDALGTQYHSYINVLGKQTTLQAPLNTITKFVYNPLGELLESIDPESNSTTYVYDKIGQLQSRTHPDAGTTSYTYDNAGNLRTVQTANLSNLGQVINYYYDFNRLIHVEYPSSLGNDVYYEYGGSNSGSQTGKLIKMQDASGVQTFKYGSMGELVENIHTFVVPGGEPYTFEMKQSKIKSMEINLFVSNILPCSMSPLKNKYHIKWTYDSWNRTKDITYPDGEVVHYAYNNAGQLVSLKGNKGIYSYNYVDSIRYDKFGSRLRIRYGNGTASKYTYNPLNRRLANLKTWDKNKLIQDIDYSYLNNGNIEGISNSATGYTDMGGIYSYTYEYDALSRLTQSGGSFTYYDILNTSQIKTYNLNMQYSVSGNISQKKLTAQTMLGGVANNISYTNDYTYSSSQPHAVVSVNDNQNYTHYMQWDANGNMTHLDNTATGVNRSMCWDEENRLTLVKDEQSSLSHYIYNAGGERVWKLAGAIERMSVNGDDFIDQALLDKTLYTNPYMILTDKGYTKHYYIENQRVTTKLGGGMANNLIDPLQGTLEPLSGGIDQVAGELLDNLLITDCASGVTIEIIPEFENMQSLIKQDDMEKEQYFYHGDHLGSSSWITDASGTANQHLQYLPFGESFIDQRGSNDIRFKFTGKERDAETGFDYFGARYYASDISVWLSVDPLSDKYPSTSPFMYVLGNPIKFIDPNGMNHDDWEFNIETGKLTKVDDTDVDIVYAVKTDDNGKDVRTGDKVTFDSEVMTVGDDLGKSEEGMHKNRISVSNTKDGEKLFKFFKEQSGKNQEWSLINYKYSDNSPASLVSTSGHLKKEETGAATLAIIINNPLVRILKLDHCHPSVETGYKSSKGDRDTRDVILKNNPNAQINIHFRENHWSNIWHKRSIINDTKYFYSGEFN